MVTPARTQQGVLRSISLGGRNTPRNTHGSVSHASATPVGVTLGSAGSTEVLAPTPGTTGGITGVVRRRQNCFRNDSYNQAMARLVPGDENNVPRAPGRSTNLTIASNPRTLRSNLIIISTTNERIFMHPSFSAQDLLSDGLRSAEAVNVEVTSKRGRMTNNASTIRILRL